MSKQAEGKSGLPYVARTAAKVVVSPLVVSVPACWLASSCLGSWCCAPTQIEAEAIRASMYAAAAASWWARPVVGSFGGGSSLWWTGGGGDRRRQQPAIS